MSGQHDMYPYLFDTSFAKLCMLYGLIAYNPYATWFLQCLLQGFGVKCFRFEHNRPGVANKILSFLSKNAIFSTESVFLDDGIYPSGLVVGKYFVCNVKTISKWERTVHLDICVYARQTIVQDIMRSDPREQSIPLSNERVDTRGELSLSPSSSDRRNTQECVKALYRTGDFGYFSYKPFNMYMCCSIHPLQQTIVDAIRNAYTKSPKNSVKILLYGQTGSGKTSIAKYLALQMNSTYVDTYNPLDPGDEFMTMYDDHKPHKKENPLIVVINEYDHLIQKMTVRKNVEHKRFPIQFSNKSTHNNFMDNLDHLSSVIFIMTSNSPPEWFDTMDASFVRRKRVDKIINVTIHPDTFE